MGDVRVVVLRPQTVPGNDAECQHRRMGSTCDSLRRKPHECNGLCRPAATCHLPWCTVCVIRWCAAGAVLRIVYWRRTMCFRELECAVALDQLDSRRIAAGWVDRYGPAARRSASGVNDNGSLATHSERVGTCGVATSRTVSHAALAPSSSSGHLPDRGFGHGGHSVLPWFSRSQAGFCKGRRVSGQPCPEQSENCRIAPWRSFSPRAAATQELWSG